MKFTNKRKLLLLLLALLLIAAAASGCGGANREDTPQTGTAAAPAEETTEPGATEAAQAPVLLDLGQGLVITELGSYDGKFVEDGSDEAVSGVLMAVVENRSDEALQLARITLEYAGGTASFQITNLPAGASALVLESNRMAFPGDEPLGASVKDVVTLDAFPLCRESLQVSGLDGVLNVKNISGADISGDIYIYYKNYSDGQFLGGITYRVPISGGLAAGELRQLATGHFSAGGSAVVMVTCGA